MKLIAEYIEQDLEVVTEAREGGGKNHFIEGVFAQAEQKNRNGRVYPRAVMEKAVDKYVTEQVKTKRAVGELNHPDGPTVNLDKVSHLITELNWDGDNVIGKAKILDTPNGQIVKGLLDGGVRVGVSTRGMGSLENRNGAMMVITCKETSMSEDQNWDQDVELHDEVENDEIVEKQTHDPKNAEAQSVAAADKAGEVTKKAPKRKGDKEGKDEPAALGAPVKAPQQEDAEYDFSDDLNALVESEATLSEEFKEKTAIIFEAAVKSKIATEIDRLEEAYNTKLDEELQTTRDELVEKVDSYLNYVVENWMEENKLAIEQGLRTDIAEGFMNSLKELFTESYIEVPESKVDLVDDLATQVEELEEQINSTTARSLSLQEELEAYKREAIIREASRDLAETQVEKLSSLVENIDFVDEDTFAKKVETVKESYFSKKTQEYAGEITEEDDSQEEEHSDVMSAYLTAIRKNSNI